MNKKGRVVGIVLMLAWGVIILYFAFQPPKDMIFWSGNGCRIASGGLGIFSILAGIMNIFYKENRNINRNFLMS